MMTVPDFQKAKSKKKLTMITCYDYSFASLLNKTEIDALLVGDSTSVLMHGYKSTVMATMDMMLMHTSAVARGAPDKLIIADMPFLSFRKSFSDTMENVQRLIQVGAHGVKLEGAEGNLEIIRHLVESGVPVMGHLGLTPQHFFKFGGNKVQARDKEAKNLFRKQAQQLVDAGCFSIVFECVPSSLAKDVAENLQVPVIGIGAGAFVDGQVLVLQDMLGMSEDFHPKFLKTYLNGAELIKGAVQQYVREVQTQEFPLERHSYF